MSTARPSPVLSVAIVDDHPVVREGIRAILSVECDISVVGEGATGQSAIRLFQDLRPDLILMDLLLPDMRGCEVIQAITEKSSDVSVLVMTSLGGEEEIHGALEAGARGYLFKDTASTELVKAIRAVHAGRRYIPNTVGEKLAEPRLRLSSRELEVLRMISAGRKNKEVAHILDISEATVNSHVKHVLEKLGANDRTDAVMIALRRGLIHL